MAYYERVHVDPDFQGVTRRERQGGSYLRYHPDQLPTEPVAAGPELAELVTDASVRVATLGQRLRDRPVPLLYATLLRSESIASSWIEGLRDTPRNVMAARLDDVEGTSGTSRAVLRNVRAMEQAVTALIKPQWTHEDVHAVHDALLPGRNQGHYREGQEFIGGSSPLTAQYVAPPPGEVGALMDDLLRFVNDAGDPPLVAASLAHAQFETIHPYADGNGRTGRVLFHGVLARAGMVDQGVLPLSLVLRDDIDGYIAALTAFRPESGDPTQKATARETYLTCFLNAVITAAGIADEAMDEVDRILTRWQPYVGRLRADSSVHRVLGLLIEQPVLTPGYVQEHLDVTRATACKALAELERLGIVQKSGGRVRRQNAYQAGEFLALMDHYTPGPPTVFVPPQPPDVPVRSYGGPRCGRVLPRKGVPCTLPLGHPGSHRAL
jgi:Fic family protein